VEAGRSADTFVVDLDGFEGPLDLLIDLARSQKVDLAKISVLALAEQYLDYLKRAHELQLDIAAEYLVMAAWLTFLKSQLLLPKEEREEPDAGHPATSASRQAAPPFPQHQAPRVPPSAAAAAT